MNFKLISLNIWQGGLLLDQAIQFLKDEDPDIIALQEVFNSDTLSLDKRFRTVQILKAEFPEYNFSFSADQFQNIDSENVDRGNLVMSKFKIKSSKAHFYDIKYGEVNEENRVDFTDIPRNLQHVEIEFQNSTINLFNTHGIWGFDNADNPRRTNMANIIVNESKGKANVIVCGDFNVDQNSNTIAIIEEQLKNIFKNEYKTSFNLKHKEDGGFAVAMVDMIFISGDLNVLKHARPEVNISDHLPVVAELELII